MRESRFNSRLSVTLILLIVNAAVYVLHLAAVRWFGFPFDRLFALSVDGLKHGMVWQLISFQFMHGGLLHLLLNCWAIFMFGRELEHTLGVKRYLWLYFSSGVIGGLLQIGAAVLAPAMYGGSVVGASAGVFGLVAAYATLFPDRVLTLLLFFIIPISMRAKFLLLFSGILALLGILFPGDNIAHAAHLGGMIVGIAYVRFIVHGHWQWPKPRSRGMPKTLVRVHSSPAGRATGERDRSEESAEDFLSKEVDPILDKISAHGIQSLTERERQILESARKRMGRR